MPGYLTWLIKARYWPQVEAETVRQWAATHLQYAQQLNDAANASEHSALFQELQHRSSGLSVAAMLTSFNNSVTSWRQYADDHQRAAAALSHAADYLQSLQDELSEIIKVNGPIYDNACKSGPWAAAAIVSKTRPEFEGAAKHYADRITPALDPDTFGTLPAPPPPPPRFRAV